MPIVNTTQARIELSREQFLAITRHFEAKFSEAEQLPPMIFFEETNLKDTVVVGGKGMPVTLVHHGGEVHELGTDG